MAILTVRKKEVKGEEIEEDIIIEVKNDLQGLLNKISEFKNKPNNAQNKVFIPENLNFYGQTIDQEVDFSNCIFEKKVKLYNCTFLHSADFNNTTFEDLVDFYGCTFKEPQQFYKTDFNKIAIFSNVTFEQEAQFIYCTTDISSSYLSFQSAKFKKGLDIARANFACKVSCWDIRVEDEGLLEAINSDYYFSDFNLKWLDENRNNKKELAKWTPASKKLRESMRFIKNNFYAENNQIEGLEFYKKEMNVYGEELKNPKEEKKITKPSKKDTKPKCFIEANIQSFFYDIKKKLLCILWSIISWGKNIISWIKDKKEKNAKYYYISIVFLVILFLSLYVIYQSYQIFWGFAIFYFVIILLEINVKNIKNAIKNSNYIPYVLLLFSTFLPLLPIYNHFDYKNNDKVYNLVMDIKQFFNTYNISSFIDSDWALIIIYPIGFIALLLAISFDFRDRILLFLNKISNNFGTNWMAGVNFTIFIGLFTLLPIVWVIYFKYNYILYFDPSLKGIGNFLYNFGQIINITEWSDIKIYGEEITGWSYVWLFIGRIFIGYGYYQTIQAFRKYGKS